MKKLKFKVLWPNEITTVATEDDYWLSIAKKAGVEIPTGCMTGSCGACEIDVNGVTTRACISNIENPKGIDLKVELTCDPFWSIYSKE